MNVDANEAASVKLSQSPKKADRPLSKVLREADVKPRYPLLNHILTSSNIINQFQRKLLYDLDTTNVILKTSHIDLTEHALTHS
jgi:hypothetical protein